MSGGENLKDNIVIFNEYIPNDKVGIYFSAADFLVVPYLSASQSGIIQIGYIYSKPAIATNVGGLPEVVVENETGFIVPPNNA